MTFLPGTERLETNAMKPDRPPAKAVRLATLTYALALLTGCSAMPSSGPVESDILSDAKSPATNTLGYRIVNVTPSVIDALATDQAPPLNTLIETATAADAAERIGPGDTLQVSIFELGSSLFGGAGGGTGSGAATQSTGSQSMGSVGPLPAVSADNLPPIVVDATGTVDIPYVGRLQAAGRTPAQLATAIRGGLRGLSQNPQVLVRIANDIANQVVVGGEVRKPGRQELTLAHEHLLDMIAIAGGEARLPQDLQVYLTRHERTGSVALTALENDPQQNVALAPGDRIQVTYQPKTYSVFGATSKVSVVPFPISQLSLAEAVAGTGGPSDDRADPNAVFLFRYEKPEVATRLGLPVRPGAAVAPVLYQLDMMKPTSYFIAQHFAMHDKDLIFIANAKLNKFYKFFNLLSTLVSPTMSAAYLAK